MEVFFISNSCFKLLFIKLLMDSEVSSKTSNSSIIRPSPLSLKDSFAKTCNGNVVNGVKEDEKSLTVCVKRDSLS